MTWIRGERSGNRGSIPGRSKTIFSSPKRPGAHLASYSMGTGAGGVFDKNKSAGALSLPPTITVLFPTVSGSILYLVGLHVVKFVGLTLQLLGVLFKIKFVIHQRNVNV